MAIEDRVKHLKKHKKGDPSPNPNGRPKGSLGIRASLRKVLDDQGEIVVKAKDVVKNKDGTYTFKLPKREMLVAKLLALATEKKANNLKAIEMIIDNTEGPNKQEIDVNHIQFVPLPKDFK